MIAQDIIDSMVELQIMIDEYDAKTAAIIEKRNTAIKEYKEELEELKHYTMRKVSSECKRGEEAVFISKDHAGYSVTVRPHGMRRTIKDEKLLRKLIGDKLLAERAKVYVKDALELLSEEDQKSVLDIRKHGGERRIVIKSVGK